MNLQKMMQQAQAMQQKIATVQAKLEAEETDGSAGGGMVSVRINGKKDLLKVTIDASLLKPDEKEVVEDLLIAAFNDAKGKVDASSANAMGQVTSGLSLPPGFKLPF